MLPGPPLQPGWPAHVRLRHPAGETHKATLHATGCTCASCFNSLNAAWQALHAHKLSACFCYTDLVHTCQSSTHGIQKVGTDGARQHSCHKQQGSNQASLARRWLSWVCRAGRALQGPCSSCLRCLQCGQVGGAQGTQLGTGHRAAEAGKGLGSNDVTCKPGKSSAAA